MSTSSAAGILLGAGLAGLGVIAPAAPAVPAGSSAAPSGDATAPSQSTSAAVPPSAMATVLEALDPASHRVELRFDLDYISPSQSPDGVRRRTRTVALMAGERFLVESGPRDPSSGSVANDRAVAFDGEYAYFRSTGTPDWLIVSRGYQVWPELAAIGVLDQSGRGIGWFGAEGRTLSLAPAPLVERRVDHTGNQATLLLAPPETGEDSRRSIEIVLVRAADGFDRILSVIEQELEPTGRVGGHQLRRLSIIPTSWETMDGLRLPSRTEFRSERPGVGGRIQREAIMIETVAAERISEEHVDTAIAAFARPRRDETIFIVEWRMQYRLGDSSFQIEGVRYATPEPLGAPSTLELDRLLTSARRIGGDGSSSPSASMAALGRWASVTLGVALIVLSVVIWRRR